MPDNPAHNIKTREDDRRGAPAGHRGNVPYQRTDEDARIVRAFVLVAGQHYTALKLGISKSTLKKYYQAEIDEATVDGVANCGHVVYRAAIGDMKADPPIPPDIRTAQWWLERRAPEVYGRNVVISPGDPVRRDDSGHKFDASGFDAEQLRGVVPVLQALIEQRKLAEMPMVDGADGRIVDN